MTGAQVVSSITRVDGSGTVAAVANVAEPDKTECPPIVASLIVIVSVPGVGTKPGPNVPAFGENVPLSSTVRDTPDMSEFCSTLLAENIPYTELPNANDRGAVVSSVFVKEPTVPR
jgi:hypothetical protein